MEASICNNCVNNTICVYQNDFKTEVKVSCELHQVEQHHEKPPKTNKKATTDAIKDLCSGCDFKLDCAFRHSEHFIFQCEHYM